MTKEDLNGVQLFGHGRLLRKLSTWNSHCSFGKLTIYTSIKVHLALTPCHHEVAQLDGLGSCLASLGLRLDLTPTMPYSSKEPSWYSAHPIDPIGPNGYFRKCGCDDSNGVQ